MDSVEFIDLSNLPTYTPTWETNNTIELYGYTITLPDVPDDEYCVNNQFKKEDQYYRRTLIPDDLKHWKQDAMEEFIEREHYRRKNGLWYLINGKKYYFTGTFYFFMTYWRLQTGRLPLFRMSDLDFFLMWFHVVKTPNIYGLVVFKCRRLGETEKSLAIIYEYASRVRNTINGMQDCRKEEEIFKTYQRLTYAHEKMIWFMKPINRGTTNPKANLEFKLPEQKMTLKNQLKSAEESVEFEFEALNSEINYYVSTPEATDGKRHGRIYIDEFGKCFGKGTKVLMFDGSYKRVEHVKVGDMLMGDDSTPRKVMNLTRGNGKLYKVSPNANLWESYVCNENHTLSLKNCRGSKYYRWQKNEKVDISLKDYFNLSVAAQKHLCLYRNSVEYETRDVLIPPYLLGLWIGDGSRNQSEISNIDPEVISYLQQYCEMNNMKLNRRKDNSETYYLSSNIKTHNTNKLKFALKHYRLLKNKHIPHDYLFNDRKSRLELLAGLIDTDGYLHCSKNAYEITQVKKKIAFEIHKLALELGFKSNLSKKATSMKRKDGTYFKGSAYRVSIFGLNLHEVPCLIERKKIRPKTEIHKNTRDSTKTCFTVEDFGVGDYYGFEVDGNHRFLLRDCQVVHNCKKLNPLDAWKYAKKSLVDEIYETLSGKALFTSTIEEEENVSQSDSSKRLEIAQQVWDDADPENLNESGETTSGMIRIVRGALERGKPDKYGFVDKERLKDKIESDKRHLIQQKKWKQLAIYQRQNCIDINDIFVSMAGDSGFNVENLVQREFRLQYEIKPQKWVRGNFEWKDFKKPDFSKREKIEVVWIPNSNGRWVVSGHPKDWNLRANAMSDYSMVPKPNNIHAFCCGIDPVAQKDVLEKNPSLGGLVVKRKFDPLIDGDKFDEEGNPQFGGEYFSTNRYVCTYLYRHKEPTDNYEDWLKTLIYYGTDFLIEKNHSAGFQTYLETNKFSNYYMGSNTTLKNHKGQSETWGYSANEKSIDHYFGLLATLTNLWWNTIDHPDILAQLKSMNYENRGKKDLGVACGICEVAAQRELSAPKNLENKEIVHFEEIVI